MAPTTRKSAKVVPLHVHASLAHLRACPQCGFRAGAPLMSEGISNEENQGCWYETCLNNRPPRYSTCNYFAWRKDIPEGRPANTETRSCPGLLCTSRADAVNRVPSAVVQDQRPFYRHYTPINAFCTSAKASGPSSDEEPELDPDLYADPDVVSPALDTSRPSVALSIGPYYRAALNESEQQQRLQAELADTEARHERARAKRHETSLRWWNENDELPQSLVVPVPRWPEFHPPDIPLLAQEFLSGDNRFQYWEAKEATWYTGSTGTAPRDLRKLSKDDLCYRSWDVKRGIGMPGQQVRCHMPEDFVPSASSLDPMPYLMTPRAHTRFSSPTPTSPPGSGSSAVSWFDETPTRPPSRSESDLPEINESLTPSEDPLPALFPSEHVPAFPTPSSSSTSPLDLSSAPRGPRGWPWRYALHVQPSESRLFPLPPRRSPSTSLSLHVALALPPPTMASSTTRSIMPSTFWDNLTAEILKLLVPLWTGSKSGSNKAAWSSALVDAGGSIDWARIDRWTNYNLGDPGENPEEDVDMRGWLMDRCMYLHIQSGKLTFAKHLKGLDMATGTYLPNDVSQPSNAGSAPQPSDLDDPMPDPANATQSARAPMVGPSVTGATAPADGPSTAGVGADSDVVPVTEPAAPSTHVDPASVRQKIAALLNMTTGNAESDCALLGQCIDAVGFKTKDDNEPVWLNTGLPARKNGRLHAKSDVALYGVDARPDPLHPRGKMVFVIMKQADLRYVPEFRAVVVKSPDVFEALAADVRFQQGNVCFTVPVAVHGAVLEFAVGAIDSDKEAHTNEGFHLHTIPLNPDMSSPSFRNIRFGVQFRADRHEDGELPSTSDVLTEDDESGRDQGASASAHVSRGKKGNLALDVAQLQWLCATNDGAFLNNAAVKLLRSTHAKSKFPYASVVTIAHTIFDIAKVGWLPDTAPVLARGTKIRYSAIGRLVGRSAGWVGLAVKLHEQLEAYKADPDVSWRLRKRRNGLVGVKTLLKEIKLAVEGDEAMDEDDGDGRPEEDKDEDGEGVDGLENEDEDDDEDGDGVDGQDDEDEDDHGSYSAEMPPGGVNYGARVLSESEESSE
ncbi:hypothetical protein GSI_03460 [Ganoderma sinense ZZ0214-1]|uniref:Uncharacterized protein n=1 Tax=Ganoderma sinense ZZ0214-1 TaxID=1077348 RepID=A0A2G8SLR1_9APHY|nr:hypothetical protein GSI_03460 [Ganoderma sinense ZZ0214-1]